jgi:hypothetical protein
MNRDVGSGLGQRNRDRFAKPSRRAGNQRNFVLQIEFVEYQGNGPFSF